MKDEKQIMENYVLNGDVYLALMRGNISTENYDNKKKLKAIQLIQKMVSEESDELIDNLLQIENWRAKLVAGCLIGFTNKNKYLTQIGENLLKGCGGVTGYCYALAKFADNESTNYLTQYLDKYLLFDKFPEEKFQDWVFSSLRWIDKKNSTTNSDSYLKENGLWTKFVNFEFKTKKTWKLGESERWGNLKRADDEFETMMNFYKQNFEEK